MHEMASHCLDQTMANEYGSRHFCCLFLSLTHTHDWGGLGNQTISTSWHWQTVSTHWWFFSSPFPLSGTAVTVKRNGTSRSGSWFHGNTRKALRSWVRLIKSCHIISDEPFLLASIQSYVHIFPNFTHCQTDVNWEPMTTMFRVRISETRLLSLSDWTGTQKTASCWTFSIVFDKWSPNGSTKTVLPRICPESGLGCQRGGVWSEQWAVVDRAGTDGGWVGPKWPLLTVTPHLLSRDVVCFKRSRRRPTLTTQVQISSHREGRSVWAWRPSLC